MGVQYIARLGATLFAACFVVAALLGLVNMVTEERIETINWEKTQEAMRAVVPDPEKVKFTQAVELTDAMKEAATAAGGTLDSVYGVLVKGQTAGYAVKVAVSGSQGSIEMMVGVDTAGAVTGVAVVKDQETSGIGSKVVNNEPLPNGTPVLEQFAGKTFSEGLSVGKNVDAISGATVTTRGITTGVNAALAVFGAID